MNSQRVETNKQQTNKEKFNIKRDPSMTLTFIVCTVFLILLTM